MEYKLNEKLIKDLREGRIALKHNMKDEELLKEVIKVAFPNDRDTPKGTTTYYFKTKINQNWWFSSTTTLPTVPLLDFIEKEEYKLPEKWCIKRNKENSEIVNDYFNKKLNTKAPYNFTSDKKYVYSDITESIDCCSSKPKDYTEITFEQFKKHVLNNTKTIDKEIIGYKAPKDLFNGKVKEGHLFVYRHNSYGVDYYSAAGTYLDLPFDIVSDWKPVYKNDYQLGQFLFIKKDICEGADKDNIIEITNLQTYWIGGRNLKTTRTLGFNPSKHPNSYRLATEDEVKQYKEKVLTLSNGKTIKISKGKIEVIGVGSIEIKLDDLRRLRQPISFLNQWDVTLQSATYKIGYWENVTLSDIKLIIKEYEELNK